MGQKDGVLEEWRSQKWTVTVVLQPVISKSDRLLEMVQKYVQQNQATVAEKLPAAGAERYAQVDAFYLGNGNRKESLVAGWDSTTQANTASNLDERANSGGAQIHQRRWINKA
ncbi:MAG: hypothetical protein ACTS8S_09390 [Giesbergeria sp.]